MDDVWDLLEGGGRFTEGVLVIRALLFGAYIGGS